MAPVTLTMLQLHAWKTARCLRWSNEPCEQETATHAIGIAFENRKRTCSLLMGVFLWHYQRQVLYLALIARKRCQFWYGNETWDLQTSKESITVLRVWVVLRDINYFPLYTSSLIGCFEIQNLIKNNSALTIPFNTYQTRHIFFFYLGLLVHSLFKLVPEKKCCILIHEAVV